MHGKEQASKWPSLKLPMATQQSCDTAASKALHGPTSGGGTQTASSLKQKPKQQPQKRESDPTPQCRARGPSLEVSLGQLTSWTSVDSTLSSKDTELESPQM